MAIAFDDDGCATGFLLHEDEWLTECATLVAHITPGFSLSAWCGDWQTRWTHRSRRVAYSIDSTRAA